MIQVGMDSGVTIAVAGVAAAAFGAFNQLAKWGIATIQAKKNGKATMDVFDGNGVFKSEDHLLITQIHAHAASADSYVRNLSTAINGQLKLLVDQGRRQIDATSELTKEMREFRLEMAKGNGRRGD